MDPALVQGSRKRLVKTEQFDDEDDEEQESMRAATPVSSVSQLTSSSSFSSSLYELKPPSRHDPQNMNFFTIPPSPSFTIPPSPSFTSSSSSSCVEPCVPGPSSSVPQYQRPSVIMRAGRDETSKLQLQADILKFHGDVLKHTGNLFSYHADLLHHGKNALKNENTSTEVKVKAEITETVDIKPKIEDVNTPEQFTDIADKIFEEAQDLLINSPWIFEGESETAQDGDDDDTRKNNILDWLQSEKEEGREGCETSVIQKH